MPPGDICSPTMEHKNSCSLIVNHMFHDSGKYCVNVGVMNDVSGANTSLMVQIPGKLSVYTNVAQVRLQPVAIHCMWVVFFVGSCLTPMVFLQELQFSSLLKNQHF